MNIVALRRPWGLRLLLPFFKLARRLFPKACRLSDDPAITPHASAMLARGNWLYRLIFPRFFAKMRCELPRDMNIAQYAEEGTLVYIGTQIGELEYNYFSHLFKQIGLPRSVYANNLSLRRYMVKADFCGTIHAQLDCMARYGGIPHPAQSGELTAKIVAGTSVLFSLAGSELQEESPLFSESHQLIRSAIRAQKESPRSIYLVPLNFIWDRRPQKTERSIIDILFGEKEHPGSLRKIVLFWRNYKRRAVVQVGTPIDLKAYFMERPDASEDELATHIRSRILDALSAERRIITGPPARPQRWFVERVLADPVFERKLSEIAVARSKSLEQLNALAKRYAREIAANINYRVLEIVDRLMRWVFNNMFEELSIDAESLARIRTLSAYTPLTFVPNHRSHVDYLLLSYIFHNHNMIVPHIAAGINLAFWPLGAIFRRCGAYFIRRTFHGNPVYRAVLQTYISILLQEGYNQEFFIEGGRTRTGKLKPPRMGMISMLSDAVADGAVDDILMVPVSLTYDRVVEQRTYTSEVSGASKKPEQRRDVLGLTRFLRRRKERNGTIFVRFGMPVSLSGAANDCSVSLPIPADRKRAVVMTLADQICYELNRNMVVTPLSVTSLALLLKARRAVLLDELRIRVSAYLDYLSRKGIAVSEPLIRDPLGAVKNALDYLVRQRMLNFHDDPEFPFYEVVEDRRIELDFFKNTSIHFFASLALMCAILQKRHNVSTQYNREELAESFGFLQKLFQFEFRFNQSIPLHDRVNPLVAFLEETGAVTIDGDGSVEITDSATDILDLFANLVANVVDAYKCALTVLMRNAGTAVNERALIKLMLETGPKLFLIGYLSRREAVSKENFTHAMAAFKEMGVIESKDGEDARRKTSTITIQGNRVSNLQAQLEKVI